MDIRAASLASGAGLAGLGNIVGALHLHEGVHFHSKGFLNAERHIPGKVSLAVKQAGQRGPGNLEARQPPPLP